MLRAHRQAWAWQDEWVGLTIDDIRKLEKETQVCACVGILVCALVHRVCMCVLVHRVCMCVLVQIICMCVPVKIVCMCVHVKTVADMLNLSFL